jgi:hypothetical protein
LTAINLRQQVDLLEHLDFSVCPAQAFWTINERSAAAVSEACHCDAGYNREMQVFCAGSVAVLCSASLTRVAWCVAAAFRPLLSCALRLLCLHVRVWLSSGCHACLAFIRPARKITLSALMSALQLSFSHPFLVLFNRRVGHDSVVQSVYRWRTGRSDHGDSQVTILLLAFIPHSGAASSAVCACRARPLLGQ